MYSNKLENLLDRALRDGVLTDKEKEILFRVAAEEGVDRDEMEMEIESRLAEANNNSASRPQKMGTLKKCPNCGGEIGGFQIKCPYCDYEFTGIEANSSAKRFFELMLDIERKGDISQRVVAIQNYPIPSTKEDLIEFLSALKGKMNLPESPLSVFFGVFRSKSKEEMDLDKAYIAKYQECLAKSDVYYKDASEFSVFKKYISTGNGNRVKGFAIYIGMLLMYVVISLWLLLDEHSLLYTLKYPGTYSDTTTLSDMGCLYILVFGGISYALAKKFVVHINGRASKK